ncbi:hypothetical protein ACH5RR_026747 [Cinchona calisaya]|uniref:Uncharacterized protein n=1 Tax=Cinchona calisaya TaxID=153742 RepID=A0ABD2Z6R6_9GENT
MPFNFFFKHLEVYVHFNFNQPFVSHRESPHFCNFVKFQTNKGILSAFIMNTEHKYVNMSRSLHNQVNFEKALLKSISEVKGIQSCKSHFNMKNISFRLVIGDNKA